MGVLDDIIEQVKFKKIYFEPEAYLKTLSSKGFSEGQLKVFENAYKLGLDYSWFLFKDINEHDLSVLFEALYNKDFKTIHVTLGKYFLDTLTNELYEYFTAVIELPYLNRYFIKKYYDFPLLTAFITPEVLSTDKRDGLEYLRRVKYGYTAKSLLPVFHKKELDPYILYELIIALDEGCPLKFCFTGDATDRVKVKILKDAYFKGISKEVLEYSYAHNGKELEAIYLAIEHKIDKEKLDTLLKRGFDDRQLYAVILGLTEGIPETVYGYRTMKASKMLHIFAAITHGIDYKDYDWEEMSESDILRLMEGL